MMRLRTAAVLLALAGSLLAPATNVLAHPIGNFSVNRYGRIQIAADNVQLHYVLDMAEIPTVTELARLNTDHDGEISDSERSGYVARTVEKLRGHLALSVNGRPVELHASGDGILELLPGQAGLQTLRLTQLFEAPLDIRPGQPVDVRYGDGNFDGQVDWLTLSRWWR
jgi:nickel/cobalt exporter